MTKIKLPNLKRTPRFLAERAFLSFLVLLAFCLIFGAAIFYRYNVLAKKANSEVNKNYLSFDEKTFQGVLKIWQEREKRFKEVDSKTYPNPFVD